MGESEGGSVDGDVSFGYEVGHQVGTAGREGEGESDGIAVLRFGRYLGCGIYVSL